MMNDPRFEYGDPRLEETADMSKEDVLDMVCSKPVASVESEGLPPDWQFGQLIRSYNQGRDALQAELTTLRGELAAAREREAALWKFYDFMFGVDATGDVMDALKSDMYAASNHELLTGDSQMNRDAVQVWADYDALLTELKALKASK